MQKVSRFTVFYFFLFFTTILPFLPEFIPFLPRQISGFNLTGYAWILMLMVSLISLPGIGRATFYVWPWIPWLLYLIIYILIDFSFLGLQLTLQYLLPIVVGVVASSFEYSEQKLRWLAKWLIRTCSIAIIGFIAGLITYGNDYIGNATTPMLLTILASLVASVWFYSRNKKFLIFFILLFLVPSISVTRMGILAMASVFIFHFANRRLRDKLIYSSFGLIALLIVFNSQSFQEKTFYSGRGTISDLSIDYYNNSNLRTNARITWKRVLTPGLKAAPVWGNGPRADNAFLTKITKTRGGEAHNDYLSVRFNYGYVGLILLLLGFFGSFISISKIYWRKIEDYSLKVIASSSLTLFIAFLLFMYSDNILKYTVFFPNYFFAILGIVYSMNLTQGLVLDLDE
jgi:hypothetical protein